MKTSKEIALLIEKLIEEKGTTVNKVLSECKLSKDFIVNLKRQNSLPSADKLAIIAQYLEVSTEYLLGISDDPTSPGEREEYRQQTIEEAIKNSSDLSEESKKDLEKYIKLLKLADKAKNMNEEMSAEMELKAKYQN